MLGGRQRMVAGGSRVVRRGDVRSLWRLAESTDDGMCRQRYTGRSVGNYRRGNRPRGAIVAAVPRSRLLGDDLSRLRLRAKAVVFELGDFRENISEGQVLRPPVQQVIPVVGPAEHFFRVDDAEERRRINRPHVAVAETVRDAIVIVQFRLGGQDHLPSATVHLWHRWHVVPRAVVRGRLVSDLKFRIDRRGVDAQPRQIVSVIVDRRVGQRLVVRDSGVRNPRRPHHDQSREGVDHLDLLVDLFALLHGTASTGRGPRLRRFRSRSGVTLVVICRRIVQRGGFLDGRRWDFELSVQIAGAGRLLLLPLIPASYNDCYQHDYQNETERHKHDQYYQRGPTQTVTSVARVLLLGLLRDALHARFIHVDRNDDFRLFGVSEARLRDDMQLNSVVYNRAPFGARFRNKSGSLPSTGPANWILQQLCEYYVTVCMVDKEVIVLRSEVVYDPTQRESVRVDGLHRSDNVTHLRIDWNLETVVPFHKRRLEWFRFHVHGNIHRCL